MFADTTKPPQPKWYSPRGTSPVLSCVIVFLVTWASVVTILGVWAVATMNANIQELNRKAVEVDQRSQAADAKTNTRVDLEDVYVKDLRERLIRAGIEQKKAN